MQYRISRRAALVYGAAGLTGFQIGCGKEEPDTAKSHNDPAKPAPGSPAGTAPNSDAELLDSLEAYLKARYDEALKLKPSAKAGGEKERLARSLGLRGLHDQIPLLEKGERTPRLQAHLKEKGYAFERLSFPEEPRFSFSYALGPIVGEERKEMELWGRRSAYTKRKVGELRVEPIYDYLARIDDHPERLGEESEPDFRMQAYELARARRHGVVFSDILQAGTPREITVYADECKALAKDAYGEFAALRGELEACLKDPGHLRNFADRENSYERIGKLLGNLIRYRVLRNEFEKSKDPDQFAEATSAIWETDRELAEVVYATDSLPDASDRGEKAKRRATLMERAWLARLRYGSPSISLAYCAMDYTERVGGFLDIPLPNGKLAERLAKRLASQPDAFKSADLSRYATTRKIEDAVLEFPKLTDDQIRRLAEEVRPELY